MINVILHNLISIYTFSIKTMQKKVIKKIVEK
jgi:hypothetical protein